MSVQSLDKLHRVRNGWAVRERLRWIDGALCWDGVFNRSDLASRFGLAGSQASGDLALYNELNASSAVYDTRRKVFRPSRTFAPLFSVDLPEWLRMRRADSDGREAVEPSALLHLSNAVPRGAMEALVPTYRAMRWQVPCAITYYSATRNGPVSTTLCPHTLFDDGARLWVRGWDSGRAAFADVCVPHVIEAAQADAATWVAGAADAEWIATVSLVLVPSPALDRTRRILAEREHGMSGGSVALTVRRAMVGHILRHLGLLEAAREGLPSAPGAQLSLGNPEVVAALLSSFDA